MGGHRVRTIGLGRAKANIGMMNLVYNMKRLVQLTQRDGKVARRGLRDTYREGAPEMA